MYYLYILVSDYGLTCRNDMNKKYISIIIPFGIYPEIPNDFISFLKVFCLINYYKLLHQYAILIVIVVIFILFTIILMIYMILQQLACY